MIGAIFGADLLIVTLIAILGVVLPLWAIGDAISRPAVAFYGAGSNKTAWIVVLAVSFFVGIAPLLALFYLVSVRRKVSRQMDSLAR